MCGNEMGGMYSMGQYMYSYPYSIYPMYHKMGMYPMGMCGCYMYPMMCMYKDKCEHKKHKKCKKHKKHHCMHCWGDYMYRGSDCKHSSSD